MNSETDFSCNHKRHLKKAVEGMGDDPFGRILDGYNTINDGAGLYGTEDGVN